MIKNIRELARFISAIESSDSSALQRLARACSRNLCAKNASASGGSGQAPKYVVGITGPPGAGKSTIVDGIIKWLRREQYKIGVVAIDPSSPFSGGALLGDRIRMQEHAADPNVFIRSVGSRGSHGGLSRATRDIVRAMQCFGMDYVIVETVGVGQTELDIMEIADATIVVLVPESGDMIQTMKAGLLEIADIFVVNKADREGAEQMKQWLISMSDTGYGFDAETIGHHKIASSSNRSPRLPADGVAVLLTKAHVGDGIGELVGEINRCLKRKINDPVYKKRKVEILRQEFLDVCADKFKSRLKENLQKNKKLKDLISDIENGLKSPYEAMEIVDGLVKFITR